jgi:hypothetical protein
MERGRSAYGVTRRRVGPLCHRWDHVGGMCGVEDTRGRKGKYTTHTEA